MPEAYRLDTQTPAPSGPFAASDAGGDYFATEGHYLSLAGRIVAELRRGPDLVLVIGDPPPDPRMLCPPLSDAGAGWYAVGLIACGPELDRDRPLRATSLAARPLFVFDSADRLSDEQIEGMCQSLAPRDGVTPAAVLLARPPFLTRLEGLWPGLVKERRASRLHLQELGREEIETFVRRQLRSDEAVSVLTAEAITAIADFSGGDPAVVNRLARLMLEFSELAGGKGAKKPASDVPISTDREPADLGPFGPPPPAAFAERPRQADATPERRAAPPLRRHGAIRGLPISILLCLAIVGFVTVPGEFVSSLSRRVAQRIAAALDAPDLGVRIEPKMDNVFPRIADVPAVAEGPSSTVARTPAATEDTTQAPTSSSVPLQAAAPANARGHNPSPSIPPAPTPPAPLAEHPLSAAEITALVERGDAFVNMRDLTTARLFYQRAAEAGDGRAAFRMGATFDPTFLDRAGIRRTLGNGSEALTWYRRARDLGDADADRLLEAFKPQPH